MPSKKILLALFLTSVLFAVVFYVVTLVRQVQTIRTVKPLPVLGEVADFQLLDTENKSFGLEYLKGKIWVADFIFTTCAGICPLMTQNMLKLYKSQINRKGVRFVSFSVNPEYDTPEVLAKYAEKFAINTKKWYLLTGPRAAMEELATNSFKMGSVENPVFHSGYFVLVDPSGQIRGYYEGIETNNLTKIKQDIAVLLKEFGYGD